MQEVFHNHSLMRNDFPHIPLSKEIGWGLLGGLIATLIMDLTLMGILVVAGLPALACYSIVGDTVASLFSIRVVETSGGILLGAAAHYLIGPLMGAMFGAAAAKVDALRIESRKKVIFWTILYAEILSQPLLAMAPILLKMTNSEMLQWFGGSFVMHMIWGTVLGVVWSLGQRLQVTEEKPYAA